VTYAYVDSIERTPAGKLRFTSTDVPVDLIRRHLPKATAGP
jgi:hypothetical protein